MKQIEAPLVMQKSYVLGKWVKLTKEIGTLADPNTGESRQPMLENESAEVESALQGARELYLAQKLEHIPLEVKAKMLRSFSESVDANAHEIAVQDSINTGIPLSTTTTVASYLGARIRGAVDEALRIGNAKNLVNEHGRDVQIIRSPLGPAVIIAPWNAPTFTIVGKVTSAIMAGCPTILKPAEISPGGCQIVSELLAEAVREHNFPEATFQLLHGGGSVGGQLTSDPRVGVISFTGGVKTGRAVAQAAAQNLTNVHLELGSNNPAVVLEDADVEKTTQQIVSGISRLNGQWCEAPNKILVMESKYDEVLAALEEAMQNIHVGDTFDEQTQIGPLAYEAHRDGIKDQLEKFESIGANVVQNKNVPNANGWFLPPTVVSNLAAEEANTELFAPILTVHKISSEEEALAIANGPGGGLAAFVFSENTERANSLGAKIHAGEVRVNGTFMADLADGSEQTFFGTSGVGGHGSRYGILMYSGERVVGVDQESSPL